MQKSKTTKTFDALERLADMCSHVPNRGELHEIGMKRVSDIFELSGWNVCLLGANMPSYDIVVSLIENKADVLGISEHKRGSNRKRR